MFDFSKGFPDFGSPEWYQLMSMMQQMEMQGGLPSQPGMIAGAGSQIPQQSPTFGDLPQMETPQMAPDPAAWGPAMSSPPLGGDDWMGINNPATPQPGTPEYEEMMRKKQMGMVPGASAQIPQQTAQQPAPQLPSGMMTHTMGMGSGFKSGAQAGAGFMRNLYPRMEQ